MSLEIGTELGSYHILGLLGRGGMGEVYRAKDLRLAREVALKVLPTDFLADEEHLARFTREAQVLATLNHPNIGAIYGLEESNGVRALILELVEGPTLADRIARRALSIDEVVGIARQIAQAVEAAHARGIIHRDLKPSNIKVRADGTTKVLDFGLAKALDATPDGQAASSVTVTRRAVTGEGIVLGTPAYMSPEQARGQSTDERADIWSFGCVLFEMITGRAPFAGNTISDTVAAVLEREPDWRLLPDAMPKRIAWLLRRCLAKDANQRLHHIADARIELDEVLSRQAESSEGVPKGRERVWWTVLVAGLLVLLSIALFVGRLRGGDSSRAPSRVYNAAIILP
ncbi:MAG: serine/threonine-protein kinase, partial [Acidobacteriota bacterium]